MKNSPVLRFAGTTLSLTRFFLSLAIAFSSLAGFILCSHTWQWKSLWAALGVFLLAAGAGVLNQIRERNRDAVMDRTKHRPLPSGAISLVYAGFLAAGLTLSGSLILLLQFGPLPAILGIGNLLWYNFVYTPLKIRSYFAVLAGAVNGAVPPVIGWVAAGGNLTDPEIVFIAFFIFLWQVPHFWLLLMMYAEDYRKAGFFSISSRLGFSATRNILLVWILATAVSSLFLPYFQIITTRLLIITMLTAIVILLAFFVIYLFAREKSGNIRPLFIVFNLFMALMFAMILTEGILP
jgi:protoheme IX farnesyltransferase